MAELVIVGSGTGIPSLRRASPCLLLLSKTLRILIDTGPGSLRRLLEVGVTYQDIDLLLYTHLHPDHTADLVPILFACKYGESPRVKDLTLFGGPGLKTFFEKLEELYHPWISPQTYRLKIKEASSQPFSIGGMKILSAPMAHLPGSLGYRFEWDDGKALVISGDTDYCESLIRLASKADLLVLECSFPDEKKVNGHLTPSLAGRIARESGSRRLLLTHLYPICDQHDILTPCRREFPGEVFLAEDLQRFTL
ncbi:MAG: MBL fold metallo-hydrolase [Desulfobacterota bacterium]|nr:MBL fold metallo-hydrolase [Thermodesulfobacteriota bacterium]